MTDDTKNPGWPDPARPGVPENPNEDGWHWIKGHAQTYAAYWVGGWWTTPIADYALSPEQVAVWTYLSPALLPAEVAAREAAAKADGMREAAGIARETGAGWFDQRTFTAQTIAAAILAAIPAKEPTT